MRKNSVRSGCVIILRGQRKCILHLHRSDLTKPNWHLFEMRQQLNIYFNITFLVLLIKTSQGLCFVLHYWKNGQSFRRILGQFRNVLGWYRKGVNSICFELTIGVKPHVLTDHIVQNSIWASDNEGKFHSFFKCRIWIYSQKLIS